MARGSRTITAGSELHRPRSTYVCCYSDTTGAMADVFPDQYAGNCVIVVTLPRGRSHGREAGGAQPLNSRSGVRMAVDGGSGNEHICAGFGCPDNGLLRDAAIDLDCDADT